MGLPGDPQRLAGHLRKRAGVDELDDIGRPPGPGAVRLSVPQLGDLAGVDEHGQPGPATPRLSGVPGVSGGSIAGNGGGSVASRVRNPIGPEWTRGGSSRKIDIEPDPLH